MAALATSAVRLDLVIVCHIVKSSAIACLLPLLNFAYVLTCLGYSGLVPGVCS